MRVPGETLLMLLLASASMRAAASQVPIVSVDPVPLSGTARTDAPVMRITYPLTGTRLAIVIVSHGNRLSRLDYQPLVSALARAGYVVFQPDHPDASIDGFTPAEAQPADSWRIRVDQLRWIANNAQAVTDAVPGLRGRADAARIAVLGHSFGGHSAALAMGAQVEGASALPPIPGLRAAVLLAPPGDFEGLLPTLKPRMPYLRTDWRTMRGPALVITGGNDLTPMTDQGPRWHDAPYERASAGRGICLMVVPDAGHYLGGIDSVLRAPAGDATPERRAAVLDAVVTFLGAQFDGRPAAQARWGTLRRNMRCK